MRSKYMDYISYEASPFAALFEQLTYPWEALPQLGAFIRELGASLDPALYVQTAPEVWVHRDAVVAPTAAIKGPCIIEAEAEIRHCAFIRGNVYVGPKSVVGNSCELKNSLLLEHVQIPHFNYAGDAIFGRHSHMGAGSITSNVKADHGPITFHDGSEHIPTSLRKFGAIIGDRVEIGCNAVLNPGTVVGNDSRVYPLTMVRGHIPAHSILKNNGELADFKA